MSTRTVTQVCPHVPECFKKFDDHWGSHKRPMAESDEGTSPPLEGGMGIHSTMTLHPPPKRRKKDPGAPNKAATDMAEDRHTANNTSAAEPGRTVEVQQRVPVSPWSSRSQEEEQEQNCGGILAASSPYSSNSMATVGLEAADGPRGHVAPAVVSADDGGGGDGHGGGCVPCLYYGLLDVAHAAIARLPLQPVSGFNCHFDSKLLLKSELTGADPDTKGLLIGEAQLGTRGIESTENAATGRQNSAMRTAGMPRSTVAVTAAAKPLRRGHGWA